MSLFRSPPPSSSPEDDLPEVHDLTTPEEARTRKRRRNLAIGIVAFVVLIAGG